jgi:hypothetical protein
MDRKNNSTYSNDSYMGNDVAAGATLTLVAVFLLSCVLFIFIGYGVDKIIAMSIAMQGNLPATQMRYDTIKILVMTFRFEPALILIGCGINTWVASTRTESGEVDLAQMLTQSSEMLFLTLGVIALTMFGGAALESIIYTMNNIPIIGTTQNGLYSAVIYIVPIFYGLCFLGLCGAIIQFVIQCVQTIDYSPSYA